MLLDPVAQLPDRLSKYQYADFKNGFDNSTEVQKFLDDLVTLATTVDKKQIANTNKDAFAAQINQQNSGGGNNIVDNSHTNISIGGNVSGGNVDIGGRQEFKGNVQIKMGDLKSSIGTIPNATPIDKEQLEELVKALQTALKSVPAEHQEGAQKISDYTDDLVKEAAKPKPDDEVIESKASLLKKAAENIRGVLPIVTDMALGIVAQIVRRGVV